MKRLLLGAAAALALVLPAHAATPPPRAEQARAFVADAESQLERMSEYAARAAWVQATYINEDSNFLAARASAEYTDLAVRLAKGAAAYREVQVDAVTRRKLYLLGQAITLPAPGRPGAAQELADLQAKLTTLYSTGKFTWKGEELTLDEMEERLMTSRDPVETRALWEGWRQVAPPMRPLYVQVVGLANEGSRELGYTDTGALWRSWYDMEPAAFSALTDRLWAQMQPFYRNLHCYVRARLNEKYGDAVQAKTGPIRADLTGNMWGQAWGNIYDIAAPKDAPPLGYDLTELLTAKGYDPVKMIRTGEAFYSSLGFAPLPESFWTRSMITRPRDREVVCHASAWNIDNKEDLRIKMCTRVNADDFFDRAPRARPQLLPARLQGAAVPVQGRGQRRIPRGDRRLRHPVGQHAHLPAAARLDRPCAGA